MDLSEYATSDATTQAELVRTGQVAPTELLDVALAAAEAVEPRLNAIVTPMIDIARERAREKLPDGPFRGVPFLVKDIFAGHAGVRQTHGSASMEHYVPTVDSDLVRLFKEAGLVIFGKTNAPEFGINPTTEPRRWGPTRNPWSLEHTTGGSSGGAAAAGAAGVVAMAHGNDGAGSIRIPASCCGLYGLKPTRARTPLRPHTSDLIIPVVSEHVLTRSVRDSAAMLDAIARCRSYDPYRAPAPERPFADEVRADPGRLRIAFSALPPVDVPVHPDCVAALDDAARLLESLGHDVEESQPPLDRERWRAALDVFWWTLAASSLEGAAALAGGRPTYEQVEPATLAAHAVGTRISAVEYLNAMATIQELMDGWCPFFDDYDLLLTPTLAQPPFPLGTLAGRPAEALRHFFIPYTPVANMSGQPAATLPLFDNAEGLPIGVHLTARFGAEATLLRVSAQLESARGWAARRPPVHAAA